VPGSNTKLDDALAKRDAVEAFLTQPSDTSTRYEEALADLAAL
jgi:flagellar biosynthesis/type III secretory pathway ATPase